MRLVRMDPVVINRDAAVFGIDQDTKEPVVSFDGGLSLWTLSHTLRPSFEQGVKTFTESEISKINDSVKELKRSMNQ